MVQYHCPRNIKNIRSGSEAKWIKSLSSCNVPFQFSSLFVCFLLRVGFGEREGETVVPTLWKSSWRSETINSIWKWVVFIFHVSYVFLSSFWQVGWIRGSWCCDWESSETLCFPRLLNTYVWSMYLVSLIKVGIGFQPNQETKWSWVRGALQGRWSDWCGRVPDAFLV